MPNYDNNTLIQNIKNLMDDHGITQTALAEILGMSQPNVSKALSMTDKKSFTLDQIAGISKHFRVSIDVLIGNKHAADRNTNPRAVAEYFVRLIEHGYIKTFNHPVEEEIYEPYCNYQEGVLDYKQYKKTINYDAFYFPAYWQLPDSLDYDEEGALFAEMTQCGNDTLHSQTNKFLHQFLQIHALYKQKGLEEETYRTVVVDLLNHLRE